jgi:hypothetical protein
VFSTEGEYWFRTDNDLLYLVSIPNVGNGVNLSFGLYDETEKEPVHSIQGTGDARRVFATVIAIVKEEVNRTKPRKIYFTAYEPSRIRLYDAFIKRLDRELPEYKISDIDPAVYPGVYQLERKDSKDEEEVYEAAGAKIDAHRVGDTIWIDYFEVHVKGKGLGKAEYEKFEKSLPKDIKKIRLVASDAGYGPTHDFWDRMGFDYAYPDDDNEMVKLLEASGYIPSKKEANDPRYSAALTVDVHPDTMKKGAKGFGWKISRAGIPPQARPDGKIDESVINEGMTFNPVVEKEFLSGDWKGEKYWSGSDWERKVTIDCRDCDGTGKDRDHVCPYCRGTGKEEETVSAAPELQVSNANGEEIQRMLGLDPDYSGIIHNKDLPDTMRRLIRLKNKGSQQHTQDASVDRGAMRQQSDDQGVTHIGRGATMYDAGRSQSQVDRYIDQLIKIIKFAQENNTSLGWG